LDLAQALDEYVFLDDARIMGRLSLDLGNIYLAPGKSMHNGSILFYALQSDLQQIEANLPAENDRPALVQALHATLAQIDQVMAPLDQAAMQRADAALILAEYRWAARMLRHGCWRILWAVGKLSQNEDLALRQRLADEALVLLQAHGELWQKRSRPGGFAESAARLEEMRRAYLS
jgi:hypothetical protein